MAVFTQTENTMSETGKIIRNTDAGLNAMMMERGTLETGDMMSGMDMELAALQTELRLLETGKMA